jgi:endonuclease YncB( thermonuclease family)|tara:strand:- start:364 stop:885 length:522 start_codon:yes stop_codon:yes gene_type:complete
MKKLNLILSNLIFIFLFSTSPTYSDEKDTIIGKAIVLDGDTIKIKGERIRFGGIDAPESYYKGKEQTCFEDGNNVFCGQISKEKLIEKIGNNTLNCKVQKNKDRYKRLIGECFLKEESLSIFMVRNGYAFDWPFYSKGKFAKDQKYAKIKKLGFWNMRFEYPWKWREKIRKNK